MSVRFCATTALSMMLELVGHVAEIYAQADKEKGNAATTKCSSRNLFIRRLYRGHVAQVPLDDAGRARMRSPRDAPRWCCYISSASRWVAARVANTKSSEVRWTSPTAWRSEIASRVSSSRPISRISSSID